MKTKARSVAAGDRVVVEIDGKKSSWHVNEVHQSGRKPEDIVTLHLDRTVHGERQKITRGYKLNHRVDVR